MAEKNLHPEDLSEASLEAMFKKIVSSSEPIFTNFDARVYYIDADDLRWKFCNLNDPDNFDVKN